MKHRTSFERGPYVEARVNAVVRDDLIQYLNKNGIGARPAFPAIKYAKYIHTNREVSTPNAEAWSKEVLYLPSGPALELNRVEYICEVIHNYYEKGPEVFGR